MKCSGCPCPFFFFYCLLGIDLSFFLAEDSAAAKRLRLPSLLFSAVNLTIVSMLLERVPLCIERGSRERTNHENYIFTDNVFCDNYSVPECPLLPATLIVLG